MAGWLVATHRASRIAEIARLSQPSTGLGGDGSPCRQHSGLLTRHVHLDLVVVEESDLDPLVASGADLLVVDDVVAGGAVAALVELELVPAQACN